MGSALYLGCGKLGFFGGVDVGSAPGWHLATPDELEQSCVDGQCVETGDADEGAVERALAHLQRVQAGSAHRVTACQRHWRLLCCLLHRNCCPVAIALHIKCQDSYFIFFHSPQTPVYKQDRIGTLTTVDPGLAS